MIKSFKTFSTAIVGLMAMVSSASQAADASQALQQQIKTLNSYQATFAQQVLDADKKEVQTGHGEFMMSRPGLFRWESKAPGENLMISDGKTLWLYDIELEQVTLMDADAAVDSTPFALLASDDPALWKRYVIEQQRDAFTIFSTNEESQVKALTVTIKDGKLTALSILDVSEQSSNYTFSNIQINQPLAKTNFSLTLPEDVDVDDQRSNR